MQPGSPDPASGLAATLRERHMNRKLSEDTKAKIKDDALVALSSGITSVPFPVLTPEHTYWLQIQAEARNEPNWP